MLLHESSEPPPGSAEAFSTSNFSVFTPVNFKMAAEETWFTSRNSSRTTAGKSPTFSWYFRPQIYVAT